jgi:hypothetical protein
MLRTLVTVLLGGCIAGPTAGERPGPSEAPAPVLAAPVPVVPLRAEIAAPPPPFAGRSEVALHEVVAEMSAIADAMIEMPSVRDDFAALARRHGLRDDAATLRDYARIKLAFETTRDGGLWHLGWTITNRNPRSDAIWSQWADARTPEGERDREPTAWAECDELSALFAFVAHRLGVREVGLFWPTGNHTVAVWSTTGSHDEPVRIVVPTSQIFLDEDASLGTDGFDPWKQKKIWDYRRRDVADDHPLPAELARFFVEQARAHAGRPQVELQAERNARSARLGGS